MRLAQYSVDGALLNSHSSGIDMRSVFTRIRGSAPLLARGYNSGQIRTQTSPGVFGNDVILTGAGTSFDSYFSFSYTGPFHRGYVYVLEAVPGGGGSSADREEHQPGHYRTGRNTN